MLIQTSTGVDFFLALIKKKKKRPGKEINNVNKIWGRNVLLKVTISFQLN